MPRKKKSQTQSSESSPPAKAPVEAPTEKPQEAPIPQEIPQAPETLQRPKQPSLAPGVEQAVLGSLDGVTTVGGKPNGKVTWERQTPAQDVDSPGQTVPKKYPFDLNAELGAPDSPEAVGSGITMRTLPGVTEALDALRAGTLKIPPVSDSGEAKKSSTDAALPQNILSAAASVENSSPNDLELEEVFRHLGNERLAKQTLASVLTVFMGQPQGLRIEKRQEILEKFREATEDSFSITLWSQALKGWGTRFGAKKLAQTLAGCLMVKTILDMLESEAGVDE